MKPKTIILMVVAVSCGLAASYMTARVLGQRQAPAQQNVQEEKIKILVAKTKVPVGVLIKDPTRYFVEKLVTKGEEPKKSLKSFDQVKDRRMVRTLAEEQVVTPEDLMDKNSTSIEASLPAGMRALAMKVNAESIAGGFVLPHSRVDVVCTVRHGDESQSSIILQNMLVLASDGNRERQEEKQAVLASTVTLAAKPEDAEKIRLAAALGELSLLLRGTDDDEIVKIKPIKPRDVMRSSSDASVASQTEDGNTGSSTTKGVPDVPATAPSPLVKADREPEVAPKPPKTLTQVITNGETITKTVFVSREDGEFSTQVEKAGFDAPPRPEKKATPEKEPAKPEPADPKAGEPKTGEPKAAEPKKDGNDASKPDAR